MYKIGFDNLTFSEKTNDSTVRMFRGSIIKTLKKNKDKEPKGNAENGSYCPKNKFGQSWAYTKETNKEEEED